MPPAGVTMPIQRISYARLIRALRRSGTVRFTPFSENMKKITGECC